MSAPGTITMTGTIVKLVRANSSVNGNPAWKITLDVNGEWFTRRTQSDAQVSYAVDNFRNGERVTLTMTVHGRVWDMKAA